MEFNGSYPHNYMVLKMLDVFLLFAQLTSYTRFTCNDQFTISVAATVVEQGGLVTTFIAEISSI